MLIVHTADLHIGAFSGRPLRFANVDAFEEIADFVIENGIKYFVVAGDFFERPRIESYELLRRIYRILRVLRDNGVFTVSVPGSHDASIRRADLLTLLGEAGLVHIPYYEEMNGKLVLYTLEHGDFVFYGLPGLKNNMEIDYLRGHKVVFRDIDKYSGKKIILVAHTSVKFAGYDPSVYSYRYGKSVIADEEVLQAIPDKIDYVALGHIHFPTPLFDEAELNIAYPGSPIGRDASDLYETLLLRKEHGKDRRFLVLDLSGDKPVAKSIWRSFNVVVEHYKDYYKGYESLISEVRKIIRDMGEGYRVLILDIEGLKPEDKNKVLQTLREYEVSYKTLIHLRSSTRNIVSEALSIDLSDVTDIEEIEKTAVAEAIKKLGLKIEPEKILELISILGERKPEDARKDEFYEALFKRIKPLLEEILGVTEQR